MRGGAQGEGTHKKGESKEDGHKRGRHTKAKTTGRPRGRPKRGKSKTGCTKWRGWERKHKVKGLEEVQVCQAVRCCEQVRVYGSGMIVKV